MARYTYDQFRQNAQNSGLLGEFSQADLQMAQRNPDFGMSILKYKQDYHNATTDEARALANQNAENLRSSWGSYTGGGDGGSFTMDLMSPGHFQYGSAPTYENPYAGDIAELWQKQQDYGDFTYDPYESRYDETIQDLIAGILERPDFAYDPATDPLYQNYRKQYTREGQRATEDALGAAAAASGGIPSSYASTAAGQAGNYYAAQLTDKIPELYELAYNKYLNDYNMQLSDLGVVQGQDQTDYDRYLNDRSLDYNVWLNGYNQLNNDLQTALGLQDAGFNQYLAALDQYNTDRNFSYGQFLDEINDQQNERAQALQNAVLAGEYGDYSFLNNMGINTDNNPMIQEQNAQLQALAQAQVDSILSAGGTPSAELLAQSGYSQEYANALGNYYRQQQRAGGSSGRSYGRGGGAGGSGGAGDSGIIQTMLGLGDDISAYEYLVGLGYNNTITENLWNMYQEQRKNVGGEKTVDGGPTAEQQQLSQDILAMLPGAGAVSPTGQGQAAMNASQFDEMGRSIAASLSQIRDEADVERLLGGLDGVWGQLSPDQKNRIQQLLNTYGYQYME